MDEKSNEGWHLRKEITLGQIVTILALIVAGLTAYYDLKGDVRKNAVQIAAQAARVERMEDRTNSTMADIKTTLRRLWDVTRDIDRKVSLAEKGK